MKKIMTYAAMMAATAGLFTACSKSDDPIDQQQQAGDTYAAVSIVMNGDNFRADENPEEDYYVAGSWNGNDYIKSVDVYIVDKYTDAISKGNYVLSDFEISGQRDESGQLDEQNPELKLTPKKAIKTTAGTKNVYVVVNASDKIQNELDGASNKPNKTEFLQKWAQAQEAFAANASASDAKAGMKKIATQTPDKKDFIMMTNKDVNDVVINPNVKAYDAIHSRNNHAFVSVQRVVARVIVTKKEGLDKVELRDPRYKGGQEVLGTLKDFKYAVAQGARKFYLQQRVEGESPNKVYKTPDYDFTTNFTWNNMRSWYDYSGLTVKTPVPVTKGGVFKDVEEQTPVFILPVTHKKGTIDDNTDPSDEMRGYTGGYRRGNTPYVLVSAKFTPSENAIVDGVKPENLVDDTFYVGTFNNAIYGNKDNVNNPEKGGVKGQKCRTYEKGKVLYFAYINPNVRERKSTANAPVYRNNVFRINITGFTALGYNWNPFFPDGGGFDNPDKNPDPDVPSPLKPTDPLFDQNIYMSVDVTVLKWIVHTYDAELGL